MRESCFGQGKQLRAQRRYTQFTRNPMCNSRLRTRRISLIYRWVGTMGIAHSFTCNTQTYSAQSRTEELDTLNRIVSMYLDFAELQALNRKPMYMRDWIAKLDEFLRVSERDILTHSGRVSHEEAIEKACAEYEKFRKRILEEPSPVERHFIEAMEEVKKLEKGKSRNARKPRKKEKK